MCDVVSNSLYSFRGMCVECCVCGRRAGWICGVMRLDERCVMCLASVCKTSVTCVFVSFRSPGRPSRRMVCCYGLGDVLC